MTKAITFLVLLLAPFMTMSEEYANNRDIERVYLNDVGILKFGVSSQPLDTCDFYRTQFKFDTTTSEGKGMYSLFLAAKMSGTKLDIWYIPSTAAGTSHNNGCSEANLSQITKLGVQ